MRPYSIVTLLLLANGAAWTQSVDEPKPVSIEGRLHDGSVDKAGRNLAKAQVSAASAIADLRPAPQLELGELDKSGESTERSVRTARRVGRVRAMPVDAVDSGSWTAMPDGRQVWRLAVRSPEASEVRVHFTDFHVGTGKVWVYSGNGRQSVQEFSGNGLYSDGDFWTATVSAERVTVEYLAGNGLRQDVAPFRIAEVGHLWEVTSEMVTESTGGGLSLAAKGPSTAPASALALTAAAGGNGREIAGCHLDVACFPEYRAAATGVARIIFAKKDGLYLCSGALVNTRSGNGTPLFLTANHCIDDEASARSVQANFFYQSESCGGGLRQVENVLGANYLISQTFSKGDYSLIRLLGVPKSEVYFFGLTTEEPAVGTKLTGIHHPAGSYKRISFGPRVPDESIAVSDGTGVYTSPADRYYQVDQRQGRTEGGSSGSPLLNAKNQIIGALSSGPIFSANKAEDEVLLCLADEVVDQYGRVSKAWPSLEPFVNDLRAGQMALPQSGDKFISKTVKFQWSPGVGVTSYRLQIGKTKGGGEYADVTLSNVASYTVENLPEDGSSVYSRLSSLIENKWESSDESYLASSGGGARAARILTPVVNVQLESSRVEFTWDEGSNVSEYMLYVGSTPGGAEFARRNTQKARSAMVENLPGNGQTIFTRLYSRLSGGWTYTDAVFRAVNTQSKTFTLRIANRLAYPVAIFVNERSVMSVRGGQSAEQTLPRTAGEVLVEWRLVRPSHPVTGIALGENLGDTFVPVTPAEALSYEIGNEVKGATYFTPFVSNNSGSTFYVEMNTGTPARGVVGAIPTGASNVGLGYYRLVSTSTVRGYYGSYGYSGAYVSVPAAPEADAGILRVNLAVPAVE